MDEQLGAVKVKLRIFSKNFDGILTFLGSFHEVWNVTLANASQTTP